LRRRAQSGSAAVELAILAPVLVILLLFVVALGRLVIARQQVDAAAADAARAASIATTTAAASQAAMDAASHDLAGGDVTCSPFATTVDTSRFVPGGSVTVQLRCTASLAGLVLLRLPGSETLAASATAPIDLYRSINSGFSNSEGLNASNPSPGTLP
jgi:Flp pilus assembly protein TadG